LKRRTEDFALRIIRLVEALPQTMPGKTMANQLIRAGTFVGANYRAARRARSRAEFVAKLGLVVEEADEAPFWLGLIAEAGIFPQDRIVASPSEANELTVIFAASGKTAGKSHNSKSSQRHRPLTDSVEEAISILE
jgi:four helix bundle protein